MNSYRRAMSYFEPDRVRVLLLLGLIGLSVGVALLEAWPLAILVDVIVSTPGRGDGIHATVLRALPESRPGQIVALALVAMAIQVVGYAVWLARMVLSAQISNRGTARVRDDLFGKLQR